jgi:gluconate kinase
MQIIVLFGLPGAGKSFIGDLLQDEFHFYHYDGDQSLPKIMKQAIFKKLPITNTMRTIFFKRLTQKTKKLLLTHQKIIVSQTFIKDKYRKYFLAQIPEAQFILIKAKKSIREKRLLKRLEYPLDIKYAQKMITIFEKPKIVSKQITNNIDGKKSLRLKLQKILD